MKKLFAMAAFAAAMILGACTGNKVEEGLDFSKATADDVVSALSEKVQSGDAQAITAAFATVQEQLNKLLEGTDVAKVTEYANKIKAFVEENAETLKSFNIDVTPLTNLFDQVKALPGNAADAAEGVACDAQNAAEEAAQGAVDAAQGAVNDAVDAAKGAVNDAVEAGKKAANDAVEAGKKAANDAVDAGKKAANDAVDAGKAAVEDAKAKTNEAIQNTADKLKIK